MTEAEKKYALRLANADEAHQIKRIAYEIKNADVEMKKALDEADKWKRRKQEQNRRMNNYLYGIIWRAKNENS